MASAPPGAVRGRRVDPRQLAALQASTSRIRNVCILAHVDHGKTTLSDGLVCSNGIISDKLAGKLRYLDNTEDEQIRGITMKSSAISLLYRLEKAKPPQNPTGPAAGAEAISSTAERADLTTDSGRNPNGGSDSGGVDDMSAVPPRRILGLGSAAPGDYLVNLIDSPGHIDFSSDVSTATRLCDIGLVVVDVLEGVCPQTHAVLRQAWSERMRPLLVLNKVDRLATELQLTPLEAWHHLNRVVENVNALTASLVASRDLAAQQQQAEDTFVTAGSGKSTANGGGSGSGAAAAADAAAENDEYLDAEELWTFRPERGDVVFASALDGWGFGLGHFARLWAKRLGCPPKRLRAMLWGDFVLNTKTMKVARRGAASQQPPMFASMILEPIWQLYDVVLRQNDAEKAGRMAVKIGVQVPPRELKHSDGRAVLQSIMRRWLPVADALLKMVCDLGPSPAEAQAQRLESLWPASDADTDAAAAEATAAAAAAAASPATAATAPVAEKQDPLEVVASAAERETSAAAAAAPQRGVGENGDVHVVSSSLSAATVASDMAAVREALSACDPSSAAPVVIFVSKMVAVKRSELLDLQGRPWRPPRAAVTAGNGDTTAVNTAGDESSTGGSNGDGDAGQELVLVAFARVFSGTVRGDTLLHVLGPRYHPLRRGCGRHIRGSVGGSAGSGGSSGGGGSGTLALYMMMGSGLHPVACVPAGNVLAVAGLEGKVQKCATLSSTLASPALQALSFQARPIMRVAVEATRQRDMAALERGLGRLYQADPAAEVSITDRGEHIISCLGELHMEQCLKDLKERYARVEFTASPPLVAFRETVLLPVPVAAAVAAAAAAAGAGDDGGGGAAGKPAAAAGGATAGATVAGAAAGAAPASWEEMKPTQLATPPWSDEEGLSGADFRRGRARALTANRQAALVVRCRPLPPAAARLLDESPEQVRALAAQLAAGQTRAVAADGAGSAEGVSEACALVGTAGRAALDDYMTRRASRLSAISAVSDGGSAFREALVHCLEAHAPGTAAAALTLHSSSGGSWDDFVDRILAFGPRHAGANILAAPIDGGRVPVQVMYGAPVLEEGPPRGSSISGGVATQGRAAGGGGNPASEAGDFAFSENGSERGGDEGVAAAAAAAAGATHSNGGGSRGTSFVGVAGDEEIEALVWRAVGSAVVAGFETAAAAGPLAGEEMHGVIFIIERIEITAACLGLAGGSGGDDGDAVVGSAEEAAETAAAAAVAATGARRQLRPQFGPLSGQAISAGRMACRAAFLCCPVRLVEAHYRCELQCDQAQLGNMYAVLSRRRGRVTKEDLLEGTQLFLLDALLPVAESFGFANELLKRTSGAGTTPQLAFSHWEVIDVDPFWRPVTEEEREDEGESGHLGAVNMARRYIDAVRRRKGLATADKIVVAAEKQRTLTRNK